MDEKGGAYVTSVTSSSGVSARGSGLGYPYEQTKTDEGVLDKSGTYKKQDNSITITTLKSPLKPQLKQLLSRVFRKELGLSTLSTLQKKHKIQIRDAREGVQAKGLREYKTRQKHLELLKLISDFESIISILKINKIEQSKASVPVYAGMNIH